MAQQTNPSWPSANQSGELSKIGAMTPATIAPKNVTAQDWQEATMPRVFGNKSNVIKVTPGATNDMPIA